MLTSACYRRCIHAFRPHISMQIFTHNPIPSKRIRSSLTFFCSIILCVVNSSLQKQREKNVMRVWHTIICREMQCHMQETRIYWEMWYLCVWHIRIRTNKTDVKIYQLAAIDELLLVRCILSLLFCFLPLLGGYFHMGGSRISNQNDLIWHFAWHQRKQQATTPNPVLYFWHKWTKSIADNWWVSEWHDTQQQFWHITGQITWHFGTVVGSPLHITYLMALFCMVPVFTASLILMFWIA
jgi:hypothetical protein